MRAVGEGLAGPQGPRVVAASGQQVVLEVASACALPLLRCCARQVTHELGQLLGLEEAAAGPGFVAGERQRGNVGVGECGGPAELRLPFRWWWGSSMDVLEANVFTP